MRDWEWMPPLIAGLIVGGFIGLIAGLLAMSGDRDWVKGAAVQCLSSENIESARFCWSEMMGRRR